MTTCVYNMMMEFKIKTEIQKWQSKDRNKVPQHGETLSERKNLDRKIKQETRTEIPTKPKNIMNLHKINEGVPDE